MKRERLDEADLKDLDRDALRQQINRLELKIRRWVRQRSIMQGLLSAKEIESEEDALDRANAIRSIVSISTNKSRR